LSDYLHIILLIAVSWDIAYQWIFWSNLPLNKQKPRLTQRQSVSVVIAARNEAPRLEKLILTLSEQTHTDFELIIVNDRSEDGSKALLQRLESEVELLKVIHIENLPTGWTGKKHALYKGIIAANKSIILLTDADCLPQSNRWIAQMTDCFEPHTDFVIGFSPYKRNPGLLNQWIQFETLYTGLQYLSSALSHMPYMGVGRNLAYRKEVFMKDAFGGDEAYVGGDDDIFVNRHATSKNTVVQISVDSQMISEPKRLWREYFKQKIRHLSAGKRYHIKDQTRLSSFTLANVVGWLLFLFLLLSNQIEEWILILFVCRSLSFYSIFTLSGQKLNTKLAFWALPLLDLCYTVGYSVVGLVALTAKRIKWN